VDFVGGHREGVDQQQAADGNRGKGGKSVTSEERYVGHFISPFDGAGGRSADARYFAQAVPVLRNTGISNAWAEFAQSGSELNRLMLGIFAKIGQLPVGVAAKTSLA
jgi:hypothetical protein